MPLRRDPEAPVLTPREIPALRPDLVDVSSVFNPGAVRWRGRDLLVLRVQTRGRTTVLLPAEIDRDGAITCADRVLEIEGLEALDPTPYHVYDPRLTVLDDGLHLVAACDFDDGCRLLTARTADFERWELVGVDADGDRRNGVLFPSRIEGRWARLQRPNVASGRPGDPPSGARITLALSDDLVRWEEVGDVLHGRPRYWDELIGAGPPPVRTPEGWLLLYHGVATHFGAASVYQAGVALLDLEDPRIVRARGPLNVLEPRTSYELTGQVPNVVFPSGWIVDDLQADGTANAGSGVRVYYGAADTVVGRAVSTVGELVEDARLEI